MFIKQIDGVEDTFEFTLNRYELERLFLAIRTAIPRLTGGMDFDSITLTALLEIHNKILPYVKDEDGAVTIGMAGGANIENLVQRLLNQQ